MTLNKGIPRSCVTRSVPLLSVLILLSACGDPAPGEGIEQPLIKDPMPEVVSASEAIQNPDVTTIDLQTMEEAEFEKVVPIGPRCSFAYTAKSPPVFASGIAAEGNTAQGAIKVHGKLIQVTAQAVNNFEALVDGALFTADGLKVEVTPHPNEGAKEHQGKRRWPANAILELEQGLKVGYRGWYTCGSEKTAET